MSIKRQSITLMFGFAAGTTVAFLANWTSKKVKRVASKKSVTYHHSIRPVRHLYDDSEINYI